MAVTSIESLHIYIHISLLILIAPSFGSDSQHKLINDKLTIPKYNPLIRPVENVKDAVTVKMGVTLFQIISVEERTQVMKTNNWIRMEWFDYQMRWKPENYSLIESIRLPCDEVWKPDIVLLNNADGKYEQSYCSNTVVNYTGEMMWIPPSIYKSSCTIDVKYFPFDQQNCSMIFGSWTYRASQLQLVLKNNASHCDLSNYVTSGTWDLIDCPAKILSGSNDRYSKVRYDLILRRKTLFYTVNLLTPCVLISFLSVLAFYLPADAQEKVTLCISILLALVVFLLLVSKSLPPTSVTMPLISKYLFFTFIMNIITVIVSVAIININFRSPRTYKMPRWIRLIFLYWLPIIMFMKRPEHEEKYDRWKERKISRRGAESTNRHRRNMVFTGKKPQNSRTRMSKNGMAALNALEFIVNHFKAINDYDEICEDWKYVAGVLDRFLLYIFLVITTAGTVSIIVDAPHIFETVDQQKVIREIISRSNIT